MLSSKTNILFLTSLLATSVLAQDTTTMAAVTQIEDGQPQAPAETDMDMETDMETEMDMSTDEDDMMAATTMDEEDPMMTMTSSYVNPYMTETNSLGVVTGQPTVVTTQPDVVTSQPAVATEPADAEIDTPIAPALAGNTTLMSVMSSATGMEDMSMSATDDSDMATATDSSEDSTDSSSADDAEATESGSEFQTEPSDGGAASGRQFATTAIALSAAGSLFAFFL